MGERDGPRQLTSKLIVSNLIYHVCQAAEWQAAQSAGTYAGSTQDFVDGFIHFSAAEQLQASVAKHRASQTGLVLLVVDADKLGDELKWEPSRGGALFPHLYGALPADAVVAAYDLPLGDDGTHIFPLNV